MSGTVKPILDGEYWSGQESFHMGPNQTHSYELTYHPLEMTTDSHKHSGIAFFPLPDGSGILYHLLGVSEPPKQVTYIVQEVPCKTPHTELLSVENWLATPQRFMVRRDILKPEKVDHTTSLDGLDYIDVPALGKKDYQLHFNSFKECAISGRVCFRELFTLKLDIQHMSIRTYIRTYIHTHTYTYIHAYIHVCTHIYICIQT